MPSVSLVPKFKEYAKVFYPLPDLPAFLHDQPDFGCWTSPAHLPDNWAMKHFVRKLIIQERFKFLEDHAFSLRDKVPCHAVVSEVIAGGKHVVLELEFEDGVRWIARIMFPQCEQDDNHQCMGGYSEENFSDCIAGMESEIATLQHVAKATSVPVPRVFGYDLRKDNDIGGPYMLMEMIYGETVAQRIKRKGGIHGSEVQLILAQVADYLSQISRLRFKELGRLRFNEDAKDSPRLEPYRSETFPNSSSNASEYVTNTIYSRLRRLGISEKDLNDPSEDWTRGNSMERKIIAASIYLRTARVLASRFTKGPFPLQHPDLNQQNIIVDEEGNVRGILDWEDAKTVPFESYDVMARLLFKQWWQVWEGMEWTDEFAYLAFEKLESDEVSKLSLIHKSPMGEIGRKLNPLTFLDFSGNVGELIRNLYEYFGDQAEQIVSKALAEEILGASM